MFPCQKKTLIFSPDGFLSRSSAHRHRSPPPAAATAEGVLAAGGVRWDEHSSAQMLIHTQTRRRIESLDPPPRGAGAPVKVIKERSGSRHEASQRPEQWSEANSVTAATPPEVGLTCVGKERKGLMLTLRLNAKRAPACYLSSLWPVCCEQLDC